MPNNPREVAETAFQRNERREAEINNAMKQEHARRESAVKNMYRLRALRIARDEELSASDKGAYVPPERLTRKS